MILPAPTGFLAVTNIGGGRWSGRGSLTAAAARYSIDRRAEPCEAADFAGMVRRGRCPLLPPARDFPFCRQSSKIRRVRPMHSSVFQQIASTLTVMTICRPVGPEINSDEIIDDLETYFTTERTADFDTLNNPFPVADINGKTIGVLYFDDIALDEEENDDIGHFVSDKMEKLDVGNIISSSTTILDFVKLVSEDESKVFFVLDIHRIVGYVHYDDIFRPMGRLALFGLALEIEDQALKLCTHHEFRERAWQSLPKRRQQNAAQQFIHKYQEEPKEDDYVRLIECTHFTDKANMLWKARLAPATSMGELLGLFNELKQLRNFCAHPSLNGSALGGIKISLLVKKALEIRSTMERHLIENKVGVRPPIKLDI